MWKNLALVLALTAAPLATARADVLTPGQAKTTALADWYANIYYTVMEETSEVVITIAPGPDQAGRPMRVVSRLADGQSQEISIGGYGENTMLTTLTVTRMADRLSFDVDTRTVSWRRKITAGPAN
jgi:predicted Zn-dependent protease